MKKVISVLITVSLLLLSLVLFRPYLDAGSSVEISGLSTIVWGKEYNFTITVYGKKGMRVYIAPFIEVIDDDVEHAFDKDGVWKVHARITHDAYISGGPFEDFVSRAKLPGRQVKVPIVLRELRDYQPDGSYTFVFAPFSRYVPVVGAPSYLEDITSEGVIGRIGWMEYIKTDDGSIKLNCSSVDRAMIDIFNGSLYTLWFEVNRCRYKVVDKQGFTISGTGKNMLWLDGHVSLGIETCQGADDIANALGKKLQKGECSEERMINVGSVHVAGLTLPIQVHINVCYDVDNTNNTDEGSNTSGGSSDCSVSSGVLQDLKERGIPFIAAPIGKSCIIVYNGYDTTYTQTDAPAVIKNGRTLLPMRFFLEALGSKIWWIPKDKKIVAVIPSEDSTPETFWQDATKLEMWIGYERALVNDSAYDMPSGVSPQIISSRTYVPLRFIGEMTGWIAQWDGDNKVAIIHK